jgi:hypothetical protein
VEEANLRIAHAVSQLDRNVIGNQHTAAGYDILNRLREV